jgi:hypothetical protein
VIRTRLVAAGLVALVLATASLVAWRRADDSNSCDSHFSDVSLDYGTAPADVMPELAVDRFAQSLAMDVQLPTSGYHRADDGGQVRFLSANARVMLSVGGSGVDGWYVRSARVCQ